MKRIDPGAGIKMFLPRTLFGRSLMIVATPVILIQIITAFVFFDSHWEKITGRLAFAVAGEIAVMADILDADDNPGQVREISAWAGQNLELLVSYEQGAILGEAEDIRKKKSLRGNETDRTLSRALEAQVRRPYRVSSGVPGRKWVEALVQLDRGVLRVSVPQRRLFSASVYILLRWMVAASIVLLAIAILFMRNQVRPIRKLAVAAERFGRGLDIPSSFKPEGAREVRQAASAFIDMQERIRRQIQQRTAMLAGVSHDLRTPLTRMKLQVAMMTECADVAALKQDIADMERMLGAYLEFVRGEGGEQTMRADIAAILERIAAGLRREGAMVEIKTDGDLSMQMRPIAIERAFANIIGNARKHGGTVWVRAERREDRIDVTIDDDGPGIPEDRRDDVFRPFYRLDPSRNTATGGVGLGLPIAQDIIHSHGGQISLSDSPHGGARFMISFPV